jgi:hypothetical protein
VNKVKKYFGKTKHIRVPIDHQDFKWYTLKDGDYIPKEIEDNFPDFKEEELSEEIEKRIKEIKEDLKDDGKLNYSNNPKKKSPGRKKR